MNYYGASFSDEFLNFVVGDVISQYEIDNKFKLSIDLESYSYHFKRTMIYYLIINEQDDDKTIYSALSKKKINGKNKMKIKLEDNGEKSNFHCHVDINININLVDTGSNNDNNMTLVPAGKETNYVLINQKINQCFMYKNSISIYIWSIIIVIIMLALPIIIGLLYYRKKKKNKNNAIDDINMDEKILSEN